MSRYFRRKRYCKFTADGVKEIDYKDVLGYQGEIPETACDSNQACAFPGFVALLRFTLTAYK